MTSIVDAMAQLLHCPFSAAVSFRKQFVGDVIDSLRIQKDRYDHHSREIQERATQLHLDSLEMKYLCSVCLTSGQARTTVCEVENTFVMLEVPSESMIERAIARPREGCGVENSKLRKPGDAFRDSVKKPNQELSTTNSGSVKSSGFVDPTTHKGRFSYGNDSIDNFSPRDPISHLSPKGASPLEWERFCLSRDEEQEDEVKVSASTKVGFGRGKGVAAGACRILDPDQVPPIEVKNMINKIHNFLLKKGSKARLHSVAPLRDKGLVMLEDSEAGFFSDFFRRPVRGYVCKQCYASVMKSLDILTRHIQSILFKASHPLLRKAPLKEIETIRSTTPMLPGWGKCFLDSLHSQPSKSNSFGHIRSRHGLTQRIHQDTHTVLSPGTSMARARRGTSQRLLPGPLLVEADTTTLAVLDDDTILSLRSTVKCGVCQKRLCSFFVRVSVLFICEYCCAWDRFYRDHAICINDEEMPLECACLLKALSAYYKRVQIQKETRETTQIELPTAPTSLFPPEECLFHIQSMPSADAMTKKATENSTVASFVDPGMLRLPVVLEERPFYDKDALVAEQNLRNILGSTRRNLFAGICFRLREERNLFEGSLPESVETIPEMDRSNKVPAAKSTRTTPGPDIKEIVGMLFQ